MNKPPLSEYSTVRNNKYSVRKECGKIVQIRKIAPYDNTDYHYVIAMGNSLVIMRNNKPVHHLQETELDDIIDMLIEFDKAAELKPHIVHN